MALRLDPSILCAPQYDIQGVKQQITWIETVKDQWQSFKGIEGLSSQVGTYKNRPVVKIKGNSLSEHLRACTSLGGQLIEFQTAGQQKNVNSIMKKAKLDQILIYITYSNGQLLWPSGPSFPYTILDVLAKEKAKSKLYSGMIMYKIYDKNSKAEVNEFSFTTTPESLKSLCVAEDDELDNEIARFKTEIQQEIDLISKLSPSITDLMNSFILEAQLADERYPSNSSNIRTKRDTDDTCWPLLIRPMEKATVAVPPKVNDFPSIIRARQIFQDFTKAYKEKYNRMKAIKGQIKNSIEVQVEILPTGINFITHFSLKGRIYMKFFIVMTVISILITCQCCYCCCFLCIVGKVRDPKHSRRVYRHMPVEMIPLAERKD